MNEALGLLVVILVIFLIFREIVCWYWKINLMVTQNALILERLDYLARKEGFESKADAIAKKVQPLINFNWEKQSKRRKIIYTLIIITIIVLVVFAILLVKNPYIPSLGRYMFPHILD